jgi:hypothetical protein
MACQLIAMLRQEEPAHQYSSTLACQCHRLSDLQQSHPQSEPESRPAMNANTMSAPVTVAAPAASAAARNAVAVRPPLVAPRATACRKTPALS